MLYGYHGTASKDDLTPDGVASTFSLIIGSVSQLLLEWGCVPFHAIYVKMYRWALALGMTHTH